jgi:predicted metal-dependent phosphoesterase TrpH
MNSPAIRDVVDLGHSYRLKKLRIRLDYLKREFGFAFPPEAEKSLFAQSNPGKPHIGNLMVRFGFAKSKDQAIREYLNRLHIREDYVRPEEAIRGILGAGGIPVLAHPLFGSGDELILGDEMDARLRRLMGFGLQGVEGFYSGFTAKLRAQVLALAAKYGLYVTAGSDYHGKNKLVRLGDTGFPAEGPYPKGWERFVQDVVFERGNGYGTL